MAERPVYIAQLTGKSFVKKMNVSFQWYPGFAVVQKQKSIKSLHSEFIANFGKKKMLEISSKSDIELGFKLSAFNLSMKTKKSKQTMSVESAFQGSKVFEKGGPYKDLYFQSSKKAKKDERIRNSGKLVGFKFFGENWPTEPKTLFYDWVYLNALYREAELKSEVLNYTAFTDIEFNPKKSINCQAYSAALFVSLTKRGLIEEALSSDLKFMNLMGVKKVKERLKQKSEQLSLPGFDDIFY